MVFFTGELSGTHVTVENDGPYKAQDDGGSSVYDIWDVYVHQFDLHQPTTRNATNKEQLHFHYFVFFKCVKTYIFFPEEIQRWLDVRPLLEKPLAPLSFLWRQMTTSDVSGR